MRFCVSPQGCLWAQNSRLWNVKLIRKKCLLSFLEEVRTRVPHLQIRNIGFADISEADLRRPTTEPVFFFLPCEFKFQYLQLLEIQQKHLFLKEGYLRGAILTASGALLEVFRALSSAGDPTQVFCKKSLCFSLLNDLSGPQIFHYETKIKLLIGEIKYKLIEWCFSGRL